MKMHVHPSIFCLLCLFQGGRPVSQKHTWDMSPDQTTNTPSSHTPRAKLESPNHPVCMIVVCRRKMKCLEKTHAGTGMGEHVNEANNHRTTALPLVRDLLH